MCGESATFPPSERQSGAHAVRARAACPAAARTGSSGGRRRSTPRAALPRSVCGVRDHDSTAQGSAGADHRGGVTTPADGGIDRAAGMARAGHAEVATWP